MNEKRNIEAKNENSNKNRNEDRSMISNLKKMCEWQDRKNICGRFKKTQKIFHYINHEVKEWAAGWLWTYSAFKSSYSFTVLIEWWFA